MGTPPAASTTNSDLISPTSLDAVFRNAATTSDGLPSESPFKLTNGGVIAPMKVDRDPTTPLSLSWKYTPPKAPPEDLIRGITPSITIVVKVYPPNPAAPAYDFRRQPKTDAKATASAAYDNYLASPSMKTGWQQKPKALLDREDLFSPLTVGDRICIQVPGRQLWWVQEEGSAGFLIWLSGGMGDSLSLGKFMDTIWFALRAVGNPQTTRDRDPNDQRDWARGGG